MKDFEIFTPPSLLACDLMKRTIGMQSIGRAVAIAYWVMNTAHVEGDVVEFGCHEGHTAALMASLTPKQVWAYDSFQGLPESTPEDGPNPRPKGDMAVPYTTATDNLSRFNPQPKVISGFFKDLKPDQLPDKIAFAHIDCDLYQSTKEALNLVIPRLSGEGKIIVDDFGNDEFPGVYDAIYECATGFEPVAPQEYNGKTSHSLLLWR